LFILGYYPFKNANEGGIGMTVVEVGSMAPEFVLPGTAGEVRLSGFRGKQNVVLYFYPKDNTPG
jgi:peroxiredoxin